MTLLEAVKNFPNQSSHRSLALTALPLSPTKSMDSKTTSRRWALHCTNSSQLSLSPIAIVCWQHRRLNTCICIGWVDKFKYKYSICQLNQYFYKYWDDNTNCATHFIWLDYLHFHWERWKQYVNFQSLFYLGFTAPQKGPSRFRFFLGRVTMVVICY